jgi:Methyl-accepting chemotaxis protein (MCP) signalling domain
MAAAVEQFNSSLGSISGQAVDGAQVGEEAVARAVQTNETIKSLSDAAEKVGSVVGLISEIVAQTNLLALNVTIEAARAGEAGEGFAVVASEVKSLAMQTSKATQEISEHIGKIQEATRRSVEEITGAAISKLAEMPNGCRTTSMIRHTRLRASPRKRAMPRRTLPPSRKRLRCSGRRSAEARHAADASLEIAKSLSNGTAEVLETINRLFEFAAKHEAIEDLSNLEQTPSVQQRPRVTS